MVSALGEDDAQQVQAIKMIGFPREDLPIDLFRISQPPGLVQRQGFGEQRISSLGLLCLLHRRDGGWQRLRMDARIAGGASIFAGELTNRWLF
jgi:hypothetical protein